jgi:Spy/CpxP family protein refolding chaperone
MSKIAFLKTVVATGGLLFLILSAAPQSALGQSIQSGAAPPAPLNSVPRGKSAGSHDLLQGLTLADEQKAKIDKIREETKSRVAAVANDKRLSPEVADAFRTGYQRSENVKILEVLTPQQRQEVRKRIDAWRAAAGKPQYPMRPAMVSERTPQPQ